MPRRHREPEKETTARFLFRSDNNSVETIWNRQRRPRKDRMPADSQR